MRAHPPSESTATFVKMLLTEQGTDYVYSMWTKWRDYLVTRGMKPPMYTSFKKYIYTLKRAGLVRPCNIPSNATKYVGPLKPSPRSYYELVPEQLGNDEAWRNPQVAVWGGHMRLGARRYRRRIMGVPPITRVGRPKGDKKLWEQQ